MSAQPFPSEYLVICRGQWDKNLSSGEIQNAIDQFYAWYNRSINEGKMKSGPIDPQQATPDNTR